MLDRERLPGLDGVRGLAILLVVAGHFTADRVPYGGAVGVTTFFVLSGFLITRVLLREVDQAGALSYRNFYIRRALRLLPAFVVVLAATPLLMAVVDDPRISDYPGQVALSFFYLTDYARAAGVDMGILEHTWSLSVEEHFYLLWPVSLVAVMGLALRRGCRKLPIVLGLLAAAMVWRLLSTMVLPSDWVQYSLDTSAFGLLLGCAAAVASQERGRLPGGRWAGLAGVLGLAALSVWTAPLGMPAPDGGAKWVEVAAGLAALVLIAASVNGFALMRARVLRWFGTISYGWYLWHFVLLNVHPDGDELQGTQRILPLLASLGAAAASWYLMERQVLRWKRRLSGDRSGRVAGEGDAPPGVGYLGRREGAGEPVSDH